jgi:hypothetical protein
VSQQIIIVIDIGKLLGSARRRIRDHRNANQNKETRQSGEERFPAWFRGAAKLFLSNSIKFTTKATISMTYVTFVLCLMSKYPLSWFPLLNLQDLNK